MSIATFLPSDSRDADPGRRERKRRQTADHLAATAFRLFETQGYDAVTMEQVATEADVAKGTLYNHFPVKEALLAYLFHQALASGMPRLRAAIEAQPDFAARMTCLLHASADWSDAHRAYLPHYLHFRLANAEYGEDNNRIRHSRSGLDQMFEALIRAGQEAGELRGDFPATYLAHMFQFLYLRAMMRWLALPGGDLRREFDAVLDLFLRGITHGGHGTHAAGAPEERNGYPHS